MSVHYTFPENEYQAYQVGLVVIQVNTLRKESG